MKRSVYSKVLVTISVLVIVYGILVFWMLELEADSPVSKMQTIQDGIWYAVATLTTVGYGDISPQTTLGQIFASIVMIMGYAIIAVPTGIVSVEMADATRKSSTQVCENCLKEGHDIDADYCKYCGSSIKVD